MGGGGGGGAILIASDTEIRFAGNGVINARGAYSAGSCGTANGSGGAIRLVAPKVSGPGLLQAGLPDCGSDNAGAGRVRIDTLDRAAASQLAMDFTTIPRSTGGFLVVYPNNLPKLQITSVAGQTVTGDGPVLVVLPLDAAPTQNVTVHPTNFLTDIHYKIVVTPESGLPSSVTGTLPLGGGDISRDVTIPGNNATRIDVWTMPSP